MKFDTEKQHGIMKVSVLFEQVKVSYNSILEWPCKTDCSQDPWCKLTEKETKNKGKCTYWLFPNSSRHEKRRNRQYKLLEAQMI